MTIKYKNKRGKREVKICQNCKEDFETLSIKVRSGGEKYCSNECYNIFRKPTEKERLEKHRLHQKKHKYNLESEDYYKMISDQSNSCAICEKVFISSNKYNSPCVDHCHESNKVRGLLCQSCNKGIGHFFDNTNLLEKAIVYLNNK